MSVLTRRELGGAIGLATTAYAAAATPAAAAERTASAADRLRFVPWIEVRPDALTANAQEVARYAGGQRVIAVVKTDGYGMGIVNAARAFAAAPAVWGMMVVRPQEAMQIVAADVGKPVLLMGARVSVEEGAELVRCGVRLAVSSPDEFDLLRDIAARAGRPVIVHADVDTGYERMGVQWRDAAALTIALARSGHARVEGLSTYYLGDDPLMTQQIERFKNVIATVRNAGVAPELIHAATSESILTRPDSFAFTNAVRPGLLLYGVFPDTAQQREGKLRLTLGHALRTRVLRVAQADPAAGAIGGAPQMMDGPRWIATLGIGVQDGMIFRLPAGVPRKRVMINGRLFPIATGRSYNHSVVELGAVDGGVKAGDIATIFGWEHPELHPNSGTDTAYWQAFYLASMPKLLV